MASQAEAFAALYQTWSNEQKAAFVQALRDEGFELSDYIGAQAPQADPEAERAAKHRAGQVELSLQYQSELAKLSRGDVMGISKLQEKYRALGLGAELAPASSNGPEAQRIAALEKQLESELDQLRNSGKRGVEFRQQELRLRKKYRDLATEAAKPQRSHDELMQAFQDEKSRLKRGDVRGLSRLQSKYTAEGLDIQEVS